MPNAYQLACYSELGVDLATLGCVMLDVELPSYVTNVIEPGWSYTSTNPKLKHVAGVPSDHHVTLKFGLMRNAHTWRVAVDEVLSGWQIPDVLHVTEISSFASPLPDTEPYRCIIMKPYAGALLDAHQRLSMLPHIDTHASYVPHITLGYVQEQHAPRVVERLDRLCLEQQLSGKVLGINYGDPMPVPSQAELDRLRRQLDDAQSQLLAAVSDACPRPHRPVQHRDCLPAWCKRCGRTADGITVMTPTPTEKGKG